MFEPYLTFLPCKIAHYTMTKLPDDVCHNAFGRLEAGPTPAEVVRMLNVLRANTVEMLE